MKLTVRCTLLASAFITATSLGTAGCAPLPNSPTTCTGTPFISPTTASLDHTVTGNSVQFTTGYTYPSGCAVPTFAVAYTWNLSDTVDAAITSTGAATCKSAALTPITVSSTIATGTNPVTYTPTGLPSATLTCK